MNQRHFAGDVGEEERFLESSIAAANDREVLAGGRVTLPNGLAFSMTAGEDAPLREKREAWIKAQFEKAEAK